MGPVSWIFNRLGWNPAKKNSESKMIHFNKIVTGISAPTSPTHSFYQPEDYRRFKAEAKANPDDSIDPPDLVEADENGSDATLITRIVRLIENIFKKALDYLHQLFGRTPLSDPSPFEKNPPGIDSYPPRKKHRFRNEYEKQDPWIILPSPPRLISLENNFTLVLPSSLRPTEETYFSPDGNLHDNTAGNSTVTQPTLRLQERCKRKRV